MPYSRKFSDTIFSLSDELSECDAEGRIAALELWFKTNEILIHEQTALNFEKLQTALKECSRPQNTIHLEADEKILLETCLRSANKRMEDGKLGEFEVEDVLRRFETFSFGTNPSRRRARGDEGLQKTLSMPIPPSSDQGERKTIRIRRKLTSAEASASATSSTNDVPGESNSLQRANSVATFFLNEGKRLDERGESRRSRSTPPASPAQREGKRVATKLQNLSADLATTERPR